MTPVSVIRRTLAVLATLGAAAASAADVDSFTPQGEVARVRQVTARFSEAMVNFGDPKAPAPFDVDCAEAGTARWVDARNWAYDFVRDVPVGVRCTFRTKPGFKAVGGSALGAREFGFSTGGPKITASMPYNGQNGIREDQAFVLGLNAIARDDTVRRHAACRVGGDTMPVRLIDGAERDEVLRRARLSNDPASPRVVLRCERPLPPQARVELVWGKDIASQTGVTSLRDQVYAFTVRGPFTATVDCTRRRTGAACDPQQPLWVRLSAPVARAAVERFVLRLPDGTVRKATLGFGERDEIVQAIGFGAPFPENADVTVEVPRDVKDDSGRPLANAATFPASTRFGEILSFIRFPGAFGLVERAQGGLLPVVLQNVEDALALRVLRIAGNGGTRDAEIIDWIKRANRALSNRDYRDRSLLDGGAATARTVRTQRATRRPETLGIPLAEPGYYVAEIDSAKVAAESGSRFVRTTALVTNLALHFKHASARSAVWVTTLDRAEPVRDARIAVRDCEGRELWTGITDANGLAMIDRPLGPAGSCSDFSGYFVSARAGDDMTFTVSQWMQATPTWRYNVPFSFGGDPVAMHTVFDRTLFRAGETVHMRHYVRRETLDGLAVVPGIEGPATMVIQHAGSGTRVSVPVRWDASGNSEARWTIPADAKLGTWTVTLQREGGPSRQSGSFRVEEFRLPVMKGEVVPPKAAQVAPDRVPFEFRLTYLSGGGSQQDVKVRAALRPRVIRFPGYEAFAFAGPAPDVGLSPQFIGRTAVPRPGPRPGADPGQRIVDNLVVQLDADGNGRADIGPVPKAPYSTELLTEMEFADANGETQTVGATTPVWHAATLVGLHAPNWATQGEPLRFQAVALDVAGKPLPGTRIAVNGTIVKTTYTSRRTADGLVQYDRKDETFELGAVCSGAADDRGLVHCDAKVPEHGRLTLRAATTDAAGRASDVSRSLFVAGTGRGWWRPESRDRVDVLPDRPQYAGGETARFQLRAPFGPVTALVTVEREGVIDARVVRLPEGTGTADIGLRPRYAPNVYVSALAVRGRVDARDDPDADGDPGRPALASGLAEVRVSPEAFRLEVQATADRAEYRVRDKASVRLRVRRADGSPLPAGSEVALAAVDEALLQLAPNESWKLLEAMLKRRPLGVQTASALSMLVRQVKVDGVVASEERAVMQRAASVAAPAPAARPAAVRDSAGAAEPDGQPRELFDTLVRWEARVKLDAKGEAVVEVPLNDSLTEFRIVAVASGGVDAFGTGDTTLRTTQPLQVVSGLPPLVREGDAYKAAITVRNTSARPMTVELRGTAVRHWRGATHPLPPQASGVTLAAGESRVVAWEIRVPADTERIDWELAAAERDGRERDAIRLSQKVVPAVPVTVQQATLVQLERPLSMPVELPKTALAGRGGIAVGVRPRLAGSLEGVTRYMTAYPYSCLEQKTSRSVALRDEAGWKAVAARIGDYLDGDGLAKYFPGTGQGSDALTAYVLAIVDEAGWQVPADAKAAMEAALVRFVEGTLARSHWSPRTDLDARKLAALEALSRSGKVRPDLLRHIAVDPNQWPTSAVIDWLNVLNRTAAIADRSKLLAEAQQILRARLNLQGTTMGFSTERTDYWYWLMVSPDANAVRAILALQGFDAWREDIPRMVRGALGRQRDGRWNTSTANAWGVLAMEKFSRRFESVAVAGTTTAQVGSGKAAFDWAAKPDGDRALIDWPKAAGPLRVEHRGSGRPWVTVQSLAAVPLAAPFSSGYRIVRTLQPVQQRVAGKPSRGDVWRVRLEIDAQADMSWVVVSDPVPSGATLLGRGLSRDSQVLGAGEKREGRVWPAFEERGFEAFRAYYAFVPKGRFVVEYTLRLNNEGAFDLPPTRVEAMYSPEMYGEVPNARLVVGP